MCGLWGLDGDKSDYCLCSRRTPSREGGGSHRMDKCRCGKCWRKNETWIITQEWLEAVASEGFPVEQGTFELNLTYAEPAR